VTASHSSGDGFPVGTTTVTVVATDASGNSSTATFAVTVVDNVAPALTLLGANPMTVEGGTTFTDPGATASDAVAGNLTASIVATGAVDTSTVGTYTRRYAVSDGYNSASAERTVNVVDTTAPVFVAPLNATVNATAPSGAAYAFVTPVATDIVDGAVGVTCTPPSGSIFPIGTTTVVCVASDRAGNAGTRTFTVTVLSAEQIVASLIGQVAEADFGQALNLLQAVLRNLSSDASAACSQLAAFVNQVEAQVARKLTAEEAAALVQLASDARGSLGCG
jgi:hypothetical protein